MVHVFIFFETQLGSILAAFLFFGGSRGVLGALLGVPEGFKTTNSSSQDVWICLDRGGIFMLFGSLVGSKFRAFRVIWGVLGGVLGVIWGLVGGHWGA